MQQPKDEIGSLDEALSYMKRAWQFPLGRKVMAAAERCQKLETALIQMQAAIDSTNPINIRMAMVATILEQAMKKEE